MDIMEGEFVMEYPKQRNLDGVYYRVKRDGKYCSRCFTDLTDFEQQEVIAHYNKEQSLRMLSHMLQSMQELAEGALTDTSEVLCLAKSFAKQIRYLGDTLDISRGTDED